MVFANSCDETGGEQFIVISAAFTATIIKLQHGLQWIKPMRV